MGGLQLKSTFGRVQTIAAGDSALAPSGRAWCQSTEHDEDAPGLAVLTLLVPGTLPEKNGQQDAGEHLQHPLAQRCITCAADLSADLQLLDRP